MASQLKSLKRRRSNGINDIPDQALFFSLFAIGTGAIWFLKINGWDQVTVTFAPVSLMVAYAALALLTKRYRLREDKVGDNIYYLGFLFTLVSLSYALYVYSPDGSGAADIITNFGIAIFTTIFGLAGRVFFNQMREDPVEYEREARLSLAQVTSELRAQLSDISIEVANFKAKMLQMLEEHVRETTAVTRNLLGKSVEQFAAANAEVNSSLKSASAAFADEAKKITGATSVNVAALEAMAEKLQKVEIPPDLISTKADSAMRKLAQVADDIGVRQRTYSTDFEHVKSLVATAVDAAEGLRRSIQEGEAAGTDRLTKLNSVVSDSVTTVERFRTALDNLTEGVQRDLKTSRDTGVAVVAGLEAHKKTIHDARESIESDLRLTREHRESSVKMAEESRTALRELEGALVSLSKTLVTQLSGH